MSRQFPAKFLSVTSGTTDKRLLCPHSNVDLVGQPVQVLMQAVKHLSLGTFGG
jgi:hypothetical protein